MDSEPSTAERVVALLANQQHGLVTRRQLLDAGLSAQEIRTRVEKGVLIPVYRGIYRVGHVAPSREADCLAAVLACGDGSLLAGQAAGHLIEVIRGSIPPAEVIAPWDRRIPGLFTRRCRNLTAADRWSFNAIPVLSPARCLVDLAASLSPYALGKACHEAGYRYRTRPRQVGEVLQRVPNSKGSRDLRRILGGEPIVLSKLEKAFLELLRREGLPLPLTNRPASGRRVDCRWPEHRLTVELDSYTFHNSRHSWEADRRREREARARRDEFRRFTYADFLEDSRYILRELRQLLGRCAHLKVHTTAK